MAVRAKRLFTWLLGSITGSKWDTRPAKQLLSKGNCTGSKLKKIMMRENQKIFFKDPKKQMVSR